MARHDRILSGAVQRKRMIASYSCFPSLICLIALLLKTERCQMASKAMVLFESPENEFITSLSTPTIGAVRRKSHLAAPLR